MNESNKTNRENMTLYRMCSWEDATMCNREKMFDGKIFWLNEKEWYNRFHNTVLVIKHRLAEITGSVVVRNVMTDDTSIVPKNCLRPLSISFDCQTTGQQSPESAKFVLDDTRAWLDLALEEGESNGYDKLRDYTDFASVPNALRQQLFDAGQYAAYKKVADYIDSKLEKSEK